MTALFQNCSSTIYHQVLYVQSMVFSKHIHQCHKKILPQNKFVNSAHDDDHNNNDTHLTRDSKVLSWQSGAVMKLVMFR